ncbi:MAG: carbohydrate kinase family protein [Candidatus Thorarchaeota archaeon]|nr:carbohydrate kinase family protein [Candidatus Thorarchaeota archaeon]
MILKMYEIVVIGNPIYNIITTPYIETDGRVLSGPAANISQTAAKLGVDEIAIIGAIGDDYRERFPADLEQLGIPEYYAIESPTTGGFHIHCDDEGHPTLTLIERARDLRIRDIPEEFLSSNVLVFAPAFGEINLELVEWISTSTDAELVLDAQGLGRRADAEGNIEVYAGGEVLQQLVELVDVVKVERPLWRLLTGETDPLLAAEYLVEHGAAIGIAMLSSMGAVVFDGNEFYIVPLEKESTRNVIAASDAFLAAFVVGMTRVIDMTERAALASSAASIVMEHSCAEFALVPEEVQSRQKSIIDRIVIK